MPVVAISSASLSIGKAVASKLSERLGAIEFSLDEAPPPFVQVSPFEFAMNGPQDAAASPQSAASASTSEVLAAAAQDNVVILDPRAPAILSQVDHVLRVRIRAPAGAGAGDETGGDGSAPGLYDVVLDAGRLSADQCANVLCDLARSPAFQPTADTTARLAGLLAESRLHDTRQPEATLRHGGSAGARTVLSKLVAAEPASVDDLLKRAEEALYGRYGGQVD